MQQNTPAGSTTSNYLNKYVMNTYSKQEVIELLKQFNSEYMQTRHPDFWYEDWINRAMRPHMQDPFREARKSVETPPFNEPARNDTEPWPWTFDVNPDPPQPEVTAEPTFDGGSSGGGGASGSWDDSPTDDNDSSMDDNSSSSDSDSSSD